ncbi:hypothetical protein [Mesorhizobium sp. M0771]|uniref:hypothetical protein n=1 Tax=Mesorhizobium sp. M0771 TaxID=2956997 RepID=UPI00333A5A3F
MAILTASGVPPVNRAYYDVARTLGADIRFLVLKFAIPESLPHVFVGLSWVSIIPSLCWSSPRCSAPDYGLGWYIQFQQAYSDYANV